MAAGNLTLSGTNTFGTAGSRGFTINSGTVSFTNASAFGAGTLNLAGGNLNNAGAGAALTVANAIAVTGGTTTNVNSASGNDFTFSGALTGSGTFQVGNTATNNRSISVNGDLSGFTGTFSYNNNAATGDNLSIQNGATVANNNNASGAKFVLSGATTSTTRNLNVGSNNSTFQMGSLSGTGGFITTNSSVNLQVGALGLTDNYAGGIAFGSNAGFTKVGTGTLTLAGRSRCLWATHRSR